jgi:RNA polymerase sigma-70 factor (sigma-E family)
VVVGPEPTASPRPDTESGFDACYRESSRWLAQLAYLLTGDRGTAEDLVQEAFAGLFRHFDGVETPRAYLRVSLVRLASRRRQREQRIADAHRLVASRESVSDASNEMFDAIAALPARQRAVVVLRYYEGLSELEISEALGCPPGTVKSLASRALDRLRREIAP